MFRGSLVALVTPMHSNGEVDFLNLERLLSWHLESGTDGFVILGTTGESATINDAERAKIISFVVTALAGKKPVIVGTGTQCTRESIELSRQALLLGADAVLLVTPYYNKPTQEGLYQHYRAIAEAVPIPQILYNNPTRTACDLLPDTLVRLASFSNIVAIKETVTDRLRYERILAETPFALLGGSDDDACNLLSVGGAGMISVVANIIPKEFKSFCDHALLGDQQAAHAFYERWHDLFSALFVESNPIPVKWVLHQMGMLESGIRLPLTELSKANQVHLKQVLNNREIACVL